MDLADESEKGISRGQQNLAIILQYDPRFTGCFWHNEFKFSKEGRLPQADPVQQLHPSPAGWFKTK
jgi:hypothetical protein